MGTHIEEHAALKSLRAEPSVASCQADSAEGPDAAEGTSPPALALAEPRSGPTPRRVTSNATAVSRTDPDARLRHKFGHRKHLVHRGQVAVDPKHSVIVAVQAQHPTGQRSRTR